jgi:hypothetical protein
MGMGARSQTVVTMATKPPMPDDVSIDELQKAVEPMHGVAATSMRPPVERPEERPGSGARSLIWDGRRLG